MPEIDEKASDAAEVPVSGQALLPSTRTWPHSAMSWTWKSSKDWRKKSRSRPSGLREPQRQTRETAAETSILLDAIQEFNEQIGRRLDMLQTTFERELRRGDARARR